MYFDLQFNLSNSSYNNYIINFIICAVFEKKHVLLLDGIYFLKF